MVLIADSNVLYDSYGCLSVRTLHCASAAYLGIHYQLLDAIIKPWRSSAGSIQLYLSEPDNK